MLPLLRIHQISEYGFSSNGDCTLLQYSDHFRQTNILIDCGIRKNVVSDYLLDLGVRKIDLVVVSHIDLDHIGGLRSVLKRINVKKLWVMNIDPIRRFVERSVGFNKEKIHFMDCFKMVHESIITAGKRKVKCASVYEGYQDRFGPFLVEILSPPFGFHLFISDPENIERILKTSKGETYRKYLEEGHLEEDVSTETLQERKKQIISEEIREPEYSQDAHEYNEEMLQRNFTLASRGLLNNISTVVHISCLAPSCPTPIFAPVTMLFPGDLEDWNYLFSKYHAYLNTSLLKIPHHGSNRVSLKNQGLYRFLTPHLSLIFPYPARKLPSQEVIDLLARNSIVSCVSCKQVGKSKSANNCCHIANTCTPLDTVVYELTPYGFSIRNGQGICAGIFRS